MKRITQRAGYIVYQSITERDYNHYGVAIGNYCTMLADYVNDCGMKYAPIWIDDAPTLESAIEWCESNHAQALKIMETMTTGMYSWEALCQIENRLNNGETVAAIVRSFDFEG